MVDVHTILDLSSIVPLTESNVRDDDGRLARVTNTYSFCRAITDYTRDAEGRIETVIITVEDL
jgi:hypothetical protein